MDFSKNKSSCDWSSLNSSLSNPTPADLKQELWKYFDSSDDEHPDAWVFCGTDDGPLYTLTLIGVRRNWHFRKICNAEYIAYDSQDMNEVVERQRLGPFNKGAALKLWKTFISTHLRNSTSSHMPK